MTTLIPNVQYAYELPEKHANFTKNQLINLNTGVDSVVQNKVTASSRTSNSLVNFKPQIAAGSVINDDMVFEFKTEIIGKRAGTTEATSTFASPANWGFSSGGLLNLMERLTVIANGKQYDIPVRDYVELISTYVPCENGTENADLLYGPVYSYSEGGFYTPEESMTAKYLGRADGVVKDYVAPNTYTDYTVASTAVGKLFSIKTTFNVKIPFNLFNNPVLGIQTLDITMQFSQTPEDLLDLATPDTAHDTVSNLEFRFTEDPAMIFTTSNLHPYVYDAIAGPKTYSILEPRLHTSVKDPVAVGAGADRSAHVQSMVLDIVPRKIWLAAKRVVHRRNGIDTESNAARKIKHTYGLIKRINSIRLNNFDLVLSSLSEYATFKLAKKNGYQHSYSIWKKAGGPICLDLSDGDVALPSNLHVGAPHTMNLQAEFIYSNPGTDNENYIIECWCEYDRYVTFESNVHVDILHINVDGKQAELRKVLVDSMDMSNVVMGGGFFGNLWSGIKKYAPRVISSIPQILSTYKAIRGSSFAPTTTGGVKKGKGIDQDVKTSRFK